MDQLSGRHRELWGQIWQIRTLYLVTLPNDARNKVVYLWQILTISRQKRDFKVIVVSYDR